MSVMIVYNVHGDGNHIYIYDRLIVIILIIKIVINILYMLYFVISIICVIIYNISKQITNRLRNGQNKIVPIQKIQKESKKGSPMKIIQDRNKPIVKYNEQVKRVTFNLPRRIFNRTVDRDSLLSNKPSSSINGIRRRKYIRNITKKLV